MPIAFEPLDLHSDGVCRYDSRVIAIREGMSEVQTISAVLHEMTHAELHDYNLELEQQEHETANQDARTASDAEPPAKPRNRRAEEIEAESLSYVVCQHYGIETGSNSFGYVANWSADKELTELKASLEIIRKSAANMIERIDNRFSEICKERDIDFSYTQKEQENHTPGQKEEAESQATTENSLRYSELQNRGFEIAQKYENLPLQDRLNIIAETFGCKTASLQTVPCAGKWRGSSDIMFILDNGASFGIGNHRTPQAKTHKVQNRCLNNIFAQYHPDIVSEAKVRATASLSKREAVDNDVAAEKGLKPYTFLNVELNNGSDKLSDDHLGWYYVTLAVEGEIIAFVETGLSSDIKRGVVSEYASKPNYFVAGGLQENEVDFVFNNVGFASHKGLYQLHLNDEARERAEKILSNGIVEEQQTTSVPVKEPEKIQAQTIIMPDNSIGFSERDLYGYTETDMLPLTMDRAVELFNADLPVYILYPDNTEAMAFDTDEIIAFSSDGIFGIAQEDWELSTAYTTQISDNSEVENESNLPTDSYATYAIYQLKDGDETRDYRFEAFERLEARGLLVDPNNYNLVYSAHLTEADTLDSLYAKFNVDLLDNFSGHSLSMSDIIVLQQNGNTSAHYVDSYGFKELPNFFRAEQQPDVSDTKVECKKDDKISDTSISTAQMPTVAELEAQVNAGQQISLLDLAKAVKNEQAPKSMPLSRQSEKKPSVLAQLQQAKKETAQGQKVANSAPKRDSEREV